jgi:uncharacterized cupredoxin-like copper-binding protein
MYRRRLILAATICSSSVVFIGCGGSNGDKSDRTELRTIDVDMKDIAYVPTVLDVKADEEVKLVFHNTGSSQHDAFIGGAAAQDEHEKEMRGTGGMSHAAVKDGITVKPGETGSIVHIFDATTGSTLVGCHEPGHYAAGMKLQVNVT